MIKNPLPFTHTHTHTHTVTRLVVLHFWAPWSQPCQHMNDVLEELAKEHTTVKFVKVIPVAIVVVCLTGLQD